MGKEHFESSVRKSGDLAGVFEYDGKVGYFYLYDLRKEEDQRVLDAIHMLTGDIEFNEGDVAIAWDNDETRVALFLNGLQWAVFNVCSRLKFGGGFDQRSAPAIPKSEQFELR